MLAVLQREKEDVQQEDVCFLSPPHYSSTVTRLIKGVACTYKKKLGSLSRSDDENDK